MAQTGPTDMDSRRHQMFPMLGDADLARVARFGTLERYPDGTRIFTAGEVGPGEVEARPAAATVQQPGAQRRVRLRVEARRRGRVPQDPSATWGRPTAVLGRGMP